MSVTDNATARPARQSQPTLPQLFGPPRARPTAPRSRVERLAAFFHRRPAVWIDGRELGQVAGSYAWRTRVSELRRPPFGMAIENRQRRVHRPDGSYVVSEYRFVPSEAATQERR